MVRKWKNALFFYMFVNFYPKVLRALRDIEFGLETSFGLRFLFYRTGFTTDDYGGRLLFVIALIRASRPCLNSNVKKRH